MCSCFAMLMICLFFLACICIARRWVQGLFSTSLSVRSSSLFCLSSFFIWTTISFFSFSFATLPYVYFFSKSFIGSLISSCNKLLGLDTQAFGKRRTRRRKGKLVVGRISCTRVVSWVYATQIGLG